MEIKINRPKIEFEEAGVRTIEELKEIAKLRNMDEKTRELYLAKKESEENGNQE